MSALRPLTPPTYHKGSQGKTGQSVVSALGPLIPPTEQILRNKTVWSPVTQPP
jgi:hypothetical protein